MGGEAAAPVLPRPAAGARHLSLTLNPTLGTSPLAAPWLPSYHPYQVLATCGVISEELISFASWARMWRSEGWHELRPRVRSVVLVSADPSCVTLRATLELRAPGGGWRPRWSTW